MSENKTYLIILGAFVAVAILVFFAGKALGKRGDND